MLQTRFFRNWKGWTRSKRLKPKSSSSKSKRKNQEQFIYQQISTPTNPIHLLHIRKANREKEEAPNKFLKNKEKEIEKRQNLDLLPAIQLGRRRCRRRNEPIPTQSSAAHNRFMLLQCGNKLVILLLFKFPPYEFDRLTAASEEGKEWVNEEQIRFSFWRLNLCAFSFSSIASINSDIIRGGHKCNCTVEFNGVSFLGLLNVDRDFRGGNCPIRMFGEMFVPSPIVQGR